MCYRAPGPGPARERGDEARRGDGVERIVRGVQVQPQLLRCLRAGLQKNVRQHVVQRLRVRRDAAVAIPGGVFRLAQLQPVQRARTRQRATPVSLPGPLRPGRVRFADHQCHQAVAAQRVVIVQILVAQRDPVDPLRHQIRQRVLDLPGLAIIRTAARDPVHQPQPPVHLAQQDAAAVRRQPTAVKTAHHFAAPEGVKFKLRQRTLCAQGTSLSRLCKSLYELTLSDKSRSLFIFW